LRRTGLASISATVNVVGTGSTSTDSQVARAAMRASTSRITVDRLAPAA